MKNNRAIWIVLLILTFLPSIVSAESSLVFRPQVGYGYMDSSDSSNKGNISHVGLRVLLSAGGIRKYGLEATKFRLNDGKSFSSLGIVLEQRLWGSLNSSIGTVGYFNYGVDSRNPVGLMTNLGWEPSGYENFKPFITYRNDIIFAEHTDIAHSVSIGIKLAF